MSTMMTLNGLTTYLAACKAALPHDAVFVCGHEAPDTDAVVSSIAEGYRRYLVSGAPTIPVIPAPSLPTEIAWLLGEPLSACLLHATDVSAKMSSPHTRFILTDHHTVRNRHVVAIVDHHMPPQEENFAGIDVNIHPVGSATTLVVRQCLKDGLVPDKAMARILLGAVLADTEGLSPAKTRAEDRLVAEQLAALWGGDSAALFADLRARLLAETELTTLYHRDYRRFDDALGFAVLKMWDTTPLDEGALRGLLAEDRTRSGVTATIAKVSRYGKNGLKNERYFICASPSLTKTLTDAVCALVGEAATVSAHGTIDLPPHAVHLSRKRLAPPLLSLLKKL